MRNVELTYPYFHDGAANTLTEAVDTMGRIQLGQRFTADENAQIVAFLKTLTGDQPAFKLPSPAAVVRQHAAAAAVREKVAGLPRGRQPTLPGNPP